MGSWRLLTKSWLSGLIAAEVVIWLPGLVAAEVMGQSSIFIYCLAIVCLYIWSLKSETASESRFHGPAHFHSRKPVSWIVNG